MLLLAACHGATDYAILYGEWCGSNVQKGVAISRLPKMLVVFEASVDGSMVGTGDVRSGAAIGMYFATDFETYSVKTDANSVDLASAAAETQGIANKVHKRCPGFSKLHMFEKINNILGKDKSDLLCGEGVVWRGIVDSMVYRFKSVGRSFSETAFRKSKPKAGKKRTPAYCFAEGVTTEARMKKASEYLRGVSDRVEHPEYLHISESRCDRRDAGGEGRNGIQRGSGQGRGETDQSHRCYVVQRTLLVILVCISSSKHIHLDY